MGNLVEFSHCGKRCVGKVIEWNCTLERSFKVEWHSKVGKHIEWFNHKELTIK